MSIDSTWLRCPNCFSDLERIEEAVFGCVRGHRFDRAKHGYLTLLPPKAPRTIGDERAMLQARARLLDGGAFEAIADAVRGAAFGDARRPADQRPRVADLGCGTGYYSARLAAAKPEARLLVADRSPEAVRMALRATPGASGVVLDIWSPLPLRDASADVILDIFAPRNPSEFARVLRAGGRLIVVVPRVAHLHELREQGVLLEIPDEKQSTVSERLAPAGLVPVAVESVEYALEAEAETRALLAGMGPSAHHADALAPGALTSHVEQVTVSVDVISFAHASD